MPTALPFRTLVLYCHFLRHRKALNSCGRPADRPIVQAVAHCLIRFNYNTGRQQPRAAWPELCAPREYRCCIRRPGCSLCCPAIAVKETLMKFFVWLIRVLVFVLLLVLAL